MDFHNNNICKGTNYRLNLKTRQELYNRREAIWSKDLCPQERKKLPENPVPVYGEVCLRKERRKRQKLLLIELFFDFAKNTTLHGLRYVTERGLTIIEKIFWLVTFVISVVMCFILIRKVWIKWERSPVIVSFSEQLVPVGMVPFPSVTICPQLKCKKTVYNYSDEYAKFLQYKENLQNNETVREENMQSIERLLDIGLICDQGILEFVSFNYHPMSSNISVVEHLLQVSPDDSDVFLSCRWHSEHIPCETIFKPVLTGEGICFNFNALAANEIFNENNIQSDYPYLETKKPSKGWSVTNGYSNNVDDPYPMRGRENGAMPDMSIILKEYVPDRDGMCNSMNKGFKIYIQHPSDMPHDSLYYYAALPGQTSSLALKFALLNTSETLKDYTAEVRQCYFEDRKLRYFKIYTANNCKLECQSNYTFESCGCVAYNMPHFDSRSICTMKSLACVRNSKERLATKEMKANLRFNSGACRCFPTCESVFYDAEILKTEFDFRTYYKHVEQLHNINLTSFKGYNFSKIELYFKESRFVSMHRSELFGLTDFLANCGGLLGLFLGFSFLSLVEIFYFVTLRLCCTLKRDLKEEKAERSKKT